ncbi:MAG TPA: ankyrin repeat domain-containing protein [Blastocatellia bacterium]|nr:ankyrin repeat domain-containing protein [Blastocatellia bacterium]
MMSAVDLMQEFQAAIMNGQTDRIKSLIERGANVRYRDKWKRTPLIWAALGVLNSAEVVRILLDSGADIDAQNNNKMTALMEAVLHRDLPVVEVLIEYGADIHITNRHGFTALSYAQSSRNPQIRELLEEADKTTRKQSITATRKTTSPNGKPGRRR